MLGMKIELNVSLIGEMLCIEDYEPELRYYHIIALYKFIYSCFQISLDSHIARVFLALCDAYNKMSISRQRLNGIP
jgi:hypothetical protein